MKNKILFQTKIVPEIQRTDYFIGSDLLVNLDKVEVLKAKKFSSFLILSDTTIFKIYGERVISSLEKFGKPIITSLVQPGEKHKVLTEITELIAPYIKAGVDRKSCLVALGGGVITDLGGFIASVLLRGIEVIYLPTTLLGQIDAAIGGKTGVDLISNDLLLKNMIGTIKQPLAVFSDIDTFSTLPEKEILNGLGEMMKYWVGWGKPTPQQMKTIKTPQGWTKNSPGVEELVKTITLCQRIKIDIIQKDPLETKGLREKLNLGHTIGHAIEGASNGKLSHGEAVSIGLAAAARISVLKRFLTPDKYSLIIATLKSLNLPTTVSNIKKQTVSQALKQDKKGGTFVLIKDIGSITTGEKVDLQLINQVLSEIII